MTMINLYIYIRHDRKCEYERYDWRIKQSEYGPAVRQAGIRRRRGTVSDPIVSDALDLRMYGLDCSLERCLLLRVIAVSFLVRSARPSISCGEIQIH